MITATDLELRAGSRILLSGAAMNFMVSGATPLTAVARIARMVSQTVILAGAFLWLAATIGGVMQ